MPAVQYVPPVETFYLDIVTRLGEARCFADLQADRVEFQGITVSVATPLTLLRMKRSTVRPKDWRGAAALKHYFEFGDDDAGATIPEG